MNFSIAHTTSTLQAILKRRWQREGRWGRRGVGSMEEVEEGEEEEKFKLENDIDNNEPMAP